MGMYSEVIETNVEVADNDKLKELNKKAPRLRKVTEENGRAYFEEWSDTKLEGHWYEEDRERLRKLATCLKGYVTFHYEEGYHFRLVFENGEAYYQRQLLDWDKLAKVKI